MKSSLFTQAKKVEFKRIGAGVWGDSTVGKVHEEPAENLAWQCAPLIPVLLQ